MAEIASTNETKRAGRKSTKKSTRVDLTPMVDLGFLLITFFIFTTTMCQQTALELDMPHDGKQTDIRGSGALTILLGASNSIYYYEGELLSNGSNFKASSFKEIRDIIIKKKRSTDPKYMYVIIKPTDGSNYRNVVDILDEMTVDVVESYSLDNITTGENQLVQVTESHNKVL